MTKYTYGPRIAWNEGDTPPKGLVEITYMDHDGYLSTWVYSEADGFSWGPKVMFYRHVTEVKPDVVTRYTGKCYSWTATNHERLEDTHTITFELDENGQPDTSSIKMALIEDDDNE